MRDDRPDREPEIVYADGRRKVLVSYSYDEEDVQAVYADVEAWWNAELWPTIEELDAWFAMQPVFIPPETGQHESAEWIPF